MEKRRPKKHQPQISPALTGMAGVYYVASELSRRGYVALPTIRNLPGIDIIVSNKEGTKHVILQVKTLKGKANYWPLNCPVPDSMRKSDNAFYVFVRFDRKQERFECFIVPAKDVAQQVDGYVKKWYSEHDKTTKPDSWTYGWWLGEEGENKYLNKWDLLEPA